MSARNDPGRDLRTYSLSKEDGHSEPFITKNTKINIVSNPSEQPNQYLLA
jgi:hypothetical protein